MFERSSSVLHVSEFRCGFDGQGANELCRLHRESTSHSGKSVAPSLSRRVLLQSFEDPLLFLTGYFELSVRMGSHKCK